VAACKGKGFACNGCVLAREVFAFLRTPEAVAIAVCLCPAGPEVGRSASSALPLPGSATPLQSHRGGWGWEPRDLRPYGGCLGGVALGVESRSLPPGSGDLGLLLCAEGNPQAWVAVDGSGIGRVLGETGAWGWHVGPLHCATVVGKLGVPLDNRLLYSQDLSFFLGLVSNSSVLRTIRCGVLWLDDFVGFFTPRGGGAQSSPPGKLPMDGLFRALSRGKE